SPRAPDSVTSAATRSPTRLRWCARTTKTNNTLNVTVGTAKKSTETRLRRWLSRKVRQVCDGGLRWRTMYLDTAGCEISTPSFCSPTGIRGAPNRGLAADMRRISARTSRETGGRPSPFRRLFQVQKSLNPVRCHRITVSGLTKERASAQPLQNRHKRTQNSRSAGRRRERGEERWRTASW